MLCTKENNTHHAISSQDQVKRVYTIVYNTLTTVYAMIYTQDLVYTMVYTVRQQQFQVPDK
jgi:hypothetical protein